MICIINSSLKKLLRSTFDSSYLYNYKSLLNSLLKTKSNKEFQSNVELVYTIYLLHKAKLDESIERIKLEKFFMYCIENLPSDSLTYESIKNLISFSEDIRTIFKLKLLEYKKENKYDEKFFKEQYNNTEIQQKDRNRAINIMQSIKNNNLVSVFSRRSSLFSSEILSGENDLNNKLKHLLFNYKMSKALKLLYKEFKTNKQKLTEIFVFIKILCGDFYVAKKALQQNLISINIKTIILKNIMYLERIAGHKTLNTNCKFDLFDGILEDKLNVYDLHDKSYKFLNFRPEKIEDLYYNYRIFRSFIPNFDLQEKLKEKNCLIDDLQLYNAHKILFKDCQQISKKILNNLNDYNLLKIKDNDDNSITITELNTNKCINVYINKTLLKSIIYKRYELIDMEEIKKQDYALHKILNFENFSFELKKANTILLIAPEISYIPIEHILETKFGLNNIFRIHSTEYFITHKLNKLKPQKDTIDKNKILCIIDNTENLHASHKRIKKFLRCYNLKHYYSLNSVDSLEKYDTLIFFGHGNGEKHLNYMINKHKLCNLKYVFLFGCSSAKILNYNVFKPESVVYEYLKNVKVLIGTLWNVLDVEMDKISLFLLKKILEGEKLNEAFKKCKKYCEYKKFSGASFVKYGI